jgi:hypothetical protein
MEKGKEELGQENLHEKEPEKEGAGGLGGEKQMDVPTQRLEDLANVVAAS